MPTSNHATRPMMSFIRSLYTSPSLPPAEIILGAPGWDKE
jgi:hypothetical protein